MAAPIKPSLVSFAPSEKTIKIGSNLPVSSSQLGRNVISFQGSKGCLFVVEEYSLTTFLGQYGAGQVVDTFSLLPGEKTQIAIRTFSLTKNESVHARTIFDSKSTEVEKRFQEGIEHNNSLTEEESNRSKIHAEASAEGGLFGFGSVKASGGGETESATLRKKMISSVKKTSLEHASKASSERKVTVSTQNSTTATNTEEESVIRQVENINRSVTLNFVVLQLMQEFVSVLHLTGLKVGFLPVNAEGAKYNVEPLSKLANLITKVGGENEQSDAQKLIFRTIRWVPNYQGKFVQVIEKAKETPKLATNGTLESDTVTTVDSCPETLDPHPSNPDHPFESLRFKERTDSYQYSADQEFSVRGTIVDVFKFSLPTRGVLTESVLGTGLALDPYSLGLQQAVLEEKQLSNKRMKLALEIVGEGQTTEERAKLYQQLLGK